MLELPSLTSGGMGKQDWDMHSFLKEALYMLNIAAALYNTYITDSFSPLTDSQYVLCLGNGRAVSGVGGRHIV